MKEKQIAILKNILDGKIKYNSSSKLMDLVYGTTIPIDYKTLVQALKDDEDGLYIDDFFTIFDLNDDFNQVASLCYNYQLSKKSFPDDYKHLVYPEKNGLLACGSTIDGDEIYWLTSDKNNWKIIVYNRSWDYIEYNMGIVEFLYKILTHQIECEFFPEDL